MEQTNRVGRYYEYNPFSSEEEDFDFKEYNKRWHDDLPKPKELIFDPPLDEGLEQLKKKAIDTDGVEPFSLERQFRVKASLHFFADAPSSFGTNPWAVAVQALRDAGEDDGFPFVIRDDPLSTSARNKTGGNRFAGYPQVPRQPHHCKENTRHTGNVAIADYNQRSNRYVPSENLPSTSNQFAHCGSSSRHTYGTNRFAREDRHTNYRNPFSNRYAAGSRPFNHRNFPTVETQTRPVINGSNGSTPPFGSNPYRSQDIAPLGSSNGYVPPTRGPNRIAADKGASQDYVSPPFGSNRPILNVQDDRRAYKDVKYRSYENWPYAMEKKTTENLDKLYNSAILPEVPYQFQRTLLKYAVNQSAPGKTNGPNETRGANHERISSNQININADVKPGVITGDTSSDKPIPNAQDCGPSAVPSNESNPIIFETSTRTYSFDPLKYFGRVRGRNVPFLSRHGRKVVRRELHDRTVRYVADPHDWDDYL